jgi:hypothetical protein
MKPLRDKQDATGHRRPGLYSVPSLFRQNWKGDGRQPPLSTDRLPGQDRDLECECWSLGDTPDNTKIYEGDRASWEPARPPLTSFWQVRACEHADFDVDI